MKSNAYAVNERIFMLDCGRKYYTPAFIKALITEIGANGFNAIAIHFSEDMGLRLESKRYPWLAGGDHSLCVYGAAMGEAENDGKFYTQDEMANIVRFAHSCGVAVIPSFDSPGHMNYAVKKYNAHYHTDIGNYFHKNGKTSIVSGSSKYKESAQLSYSRGIDLANADAVSFAKDLYREYGTFFRTLGCTAFDIGGDELLGRGETIDDSYSKWNNLDHWQDLAREKTGNREAVAYDAFVLYMNEISAMMRELGYESIRMWNDDAYRSFDTDWQGVAQLDPAIEISYWSPRANNSQNTALYYLEKGHSLYNFTFKYTYYIVGFGFGFKNEVTPERIEAEWNAYVFDGENPENNPKVPNSRVKGGGLCLWSDQPSAETEEEIFAHIKPYIAAVGKKLR